MPKYKIEYAIAIHGHAHPNTHTTSDPVEAEEFLSELLERGCKIRSIAHEGIELPQEESDQMIKTAAGILTTRNLCRSLDIDTISVHDRFGSPA